MKTRVYCAEYTRSVAFFRDTLGFVLQQSWGAPGKGDCGSIFILDSGALLELAPAEKSSGQCSLQFEVSNAAEYAKSLPVGVVSDGPVAKPWGAQYVYLNEPSGLSVIMYSQHPTPVE